MLYPAELRDQPRFDVPARAVTCKMDGNDSAMTSDDFILYPDPRLAQKAEARPLDAPMRTVGARLLAAAQRAQAYGLAAVHIGAVEPLVVISVSDAGQRDYRLLYNPRVISTGAEEQLGREGSVSLPDIEVEISRPVSARIGFDDETGQAQEVELSGFAARVAQHEIDQVNGVFFLNRLSRLKREAALRRFAKLERRLG